MRKTYFSAMLLILVFAVGLTGCSKKEKAKSSKEMGPIYQMKDPFIVNLAKSDLKIYLKTTIGFEMDNDELGAEMGRKNLRIRDIIIALLSARTPQDVSEEVGKQNLKEDIIAEINATLEDGKILQVYFFEFVVQ